MDRRAFLKTAMVTALGASVPGCGREQAAPRYDALATRKSRPARVAVVDAQSYAVDLEDRVRRGFALCGVEVAGRRVVLKPNLVEFDPQGVINTHPALVAATLEVLRSLGAREVVVAEGPGHRRDNEYLLVASGLEAVLRDTGARYVDLNLDRTRPVPLRSHYTRFPNLHLPRTVLDADLFVSMPKLKTHHWAGVTLSMKNLFGIVPGALYGWPKNPLHWQGVHASVVDLNSSLPVPRFAIVDGIVGMEGDGPILGSAKQAGVLVFGEDPVAVDASATRIMGIEPWRIPSLRAAAEFLGHVDRDAIEQVAEPLEPRVRDFAVLERYRSIKDPLG